MLKNYLKIALRNFRSHKVFTVVNMGGLAIGLACCLLIYVYIENELTYDTFHEHADQIYRVTFSTVQEGTPTNANGSYGVAPALKRDFPAVRESTRLVRSGSSGTRSLVRSGDDIYYEERFYFADSTVFDLFTLPLSAGIPEAVLSRPNTVLLTETASQKYFPNENPVGKILSVDPDGEGGWMELEVTGVLEDLPQNSHFQFDFLASIYSLEQIADLSQFNGFQQVYSYVLLEEGASEQALEAQLDDFLYRNWTDDPWYTIRLQPMLDIHLHSQLRSEIEVNGNIRYVYIFSAVAFFVLLIAGINFMNLVTARSTTRAREVGLRKTVGAGRPQLVRQFLLESTLMSLGAGVVAVLLVDLINPVFNSVTGRELNVLALLDLESWFIYGGVAVLVGLLAGIYPALMLSGFHPSRTLKGYLVRGGQGAALRKGLVVFQFCISMALIAATGVVYQQMNYIQSRDLGYAGDQILVLPLNNEVRDHHAAFRNSLLQQTGVQDMSTSSLVPTMGSSHNGFEIEGLGRSINYATYYIDEHFTETYGLDLIAGEDVRRDLLDEAGGDFLLSRKAVQEAGWVTLQQVLGKSITWNGDYTGRVTGVVNDMHIYSLREQVYASGYFITPVQYHKYISIRVHPENLSRTLPQIEQVWSEFAPGYPFEYFFLDESFEMMHRADMRLAETVSWFALLAVFVACLGLLGLSTFMAGQRTKEIGIRKVMGATVSSIVALFSRDFLRLVALGTVLAVPLAWYLMDQWLREFAYRIEIGGGIFVLAAAVLILVALATIGYSSVRAAISNPVESLRSE